MKNFATTIAEIKTAKAIKTAATTRGSVTTNKTATTIVSKKLQSIKRGAEPLFLFFSQTKSAKKSNFIFKTYP